MVCSLTAAVVETRNFVSSAAGLLPKHVKILLKPLLCYSASLLKPSSKAMQGGLLLQVMHCFYKKYLLMLGNLNIDQD